MAVVPPQVARDTGMEVVTTGLRLTGDLDEETETRIQETVDGVVADASLYVERGYQRPPEAVIVLVVLGALGGVLMLGGTLTATFLALSDARPDLATLSAVGAAPRARRRVAASYALVVGSVGAVLGAAVGFIPGVAISRPLTSFSETGPYLAVPWPLIVVIVVALPLLTAAVVGVTATSAATASASRALVRSRSSAPSADTASRRARRLPPAAAGRGAGVDAVGSAGSGGPVGVGLVVGVGSVGVGPCGSVGSTTDWRTTAACSSNHARSSATSASVIGWASSATSTTW
jgi:hypothetical protein